MDSRLFAHLSLVAVEVRFHPSRTGVTSSLVGKLQPAC